jgi:protein-S-isoprenylcysteine O-methyltransferase Ste14
MSARAAELLEAASTRASYIGVLVLLLGAVLHFLGIAPSPPTGLKLVVFLILLIVAAAFALGLMLNLWCPRLRIWPPPEKQSWQFWFIWVSYSIGGVGVSLIGVLDWGSLGLGHWSVRCIGGALILISIPLGEWGMRVLNVHQTLGLQGRLLTSGPYRYTRNPQYVSEIALYLGAILVTDSAMALAIGGLMMLWFAMAPFSEEPWLRRQFGKEYEDYCRSVPRFVGLRSCHR